MSILKSVSEGLKLSVSFKRIIPYLIMNLVTFYILINFLGRVFRLATGSIGVMPFLLSLGIYIPIFIVIALIDLWINGAMIDQAKYYKKRRTLVKSFEHSTSRYLSLFCATVIYTIIIGIVSSPPYIGWLLSLIFSLIFFFIYPAIIIDHKACVDSFKQSWKAFKAFPLETFVTWILMIIIGFIIVGVFSLPMVFYLLGNLVGTLQTIGTTFVNETMTSTMIRTEIMPNVANSVRSPYFLPFFFIFCIGLAVQSIFSVGTQARLYTNLKKREI
jgi:hypothetical protein